MHGVTFHMGANALYLEKSFGYICQNSPKICGFHFVENLHQIKKL